MRVQERNCTLLPLSRQHRAIRPHSIGQKNGVDGLLPSNATAGMWQHASSPATCSQPSHASTVAQSQASSCSAAPHGHTSSCQHRGTAACYNQAPQHAHASTSNSSTRTSQGRQCAGAFPAGTPKRMPTPAPAKPRHHLCCKQASRPNTRPQAITSGCKTSTPPRAARKRQHHLSYKRNPAPNALQADWPSQHTTPDTVPCKQCMRSTRNNPPEDTAADNCSPCAPARLLPDIIGQPARLPASTTYKTSSNHQHSRGTPHTGLPCTRCCCTSIS